MDYAADETTLLTALDRAEQCNLQTDLPTLREKADWFWILPEQPCAIVSSLRSKGLIEGNQPAIRLTEPGRAVASSEAAQRNNLYRHFYQRFYPAAGASAAHSRFCKRVFGADLCQDGQVDMAGINHMLEVLDLTEDRKVLDLGCGSGGIARYIADKTGARVTGLDYAETAIAEARERSTSGAGKLEFLQGDINALEFVPGSFDAIVSLDTLYWVDDLEATLGHLIQILKPDGQLAVFMEHNLEDEGRPERLRPPKTALAQALTKFGVSFTVHDYSAQNVTFWWRIRQAADDLREEFEREGNGFIAASLQKQADIFLPDIEAGKTTRYFYHARI